MFILLVLLITKCKVFRSPTLIVGSSMPPINSVSFALFILKPLVRYIHIRYYCKIYIYMTYGMHFVYCSLLCYFSCSSVHFSSSLTYIYTFCVHFLSYFILGTEQDINKYKYCMKISFQLKVVISSQVIKINFTISTFTKMNFQPFPIFKRVRNLSTRW